MRIRCCALWIVLSAAVLTSWGCGPRRSVELVRGEELHQAALTRHWTAHLPLERRDITEQCFLLDDTLYVTTRGGELFALDADSGLIRWADRLTAANYRVFPPSHLASPDGNGPVVFVSTDAITIYDRYAGDRIRRFPTPAPPGTGAVGDMSRLFLGSLDGHVYSYLWSAPWTPDLYERWRLLAAAPVTASIDVRPGDSLFFATQHGAVVRCGAGNKEFGWIFRTGSPITAPLAIGFDAVYAASTDRQLYAIDMDTGAELWRVRFPKPLTSGPVVIGPRVYQYCETEGVSAIDAATGALEWRRSDGRRVVASTAQELFLRTEQGLLDMVDAATGETRSSIDVGGIHLEASNPVDDAVFLVAADGRATCLRPDETPYLRKQQIATARAALNRPPGRARETEGEVPPPPHPAPSDPLRSVEDTGPAQQP